jgi:ATP-dependent DNA helicase RecQ
MPGPLVTPSLADLLHRVFGHGAFRAHQQPVCEAAAGGHDVLLVMPTGAGKSLCYQLPALARGGTGLVISPLIALMDDQAAKLAALGLRVARVHSGLTRDDARQACRDYLAGELDFLFIAPERMRVPGFPEMLAKRKPALIAIDEAHCISQWGHDFRPDYRTVGQHLAALRTGADGAPVIALTATATPAVQRDIARQLELRDPAIFITGFRRDNLAVEVLQLSKPQRAEFTEKLLKDAAARPAIVYASSRKTADELAARLNAHFPAQAYHAGLEAGTRERVQRGFSSGAVEVVVATIAFGMGVDKADVRTVVHVALPGSVEAFYQEIGRAGRDGLASRTVLLYSFADRKMQEFLLERNYPPRSELERVLRALDEEFVEPDVLQQRLKLDRETLDRALEKLIAQGVAVADWNGNVCATGESVRGSREPAWQDGYDAQVAARRAQIDRMMAFAEGTSCRMTALVEHFGDRSDSTRACGRCDICKPSDVSGSKMRQPEGREREWLRAMLAALVNRSTSTGKLFTELALVKDRKQFDALLEGLARAGLITMANDTFTTPDGRDVTYRKASITHEGRTPDEATLDTVWLRENATVISRRSPAKRERRSSEAVRAGRRERPAERPERPAVTSQPVTRSAAGPVRSRHVEAAPEQEFSDVQKQLDERLRQWRREQAQAAGLPSFFIFSDTVLREIVAAAPRSLAELRGVRGVGPEKLERFGAAVLELCQG